MKTIHLLIIVILILSSSISFLNTEAKCSTDVNGNIIGNCGSPPNSDINVTNLSQSALHEKIPMIVYFIIVAIIACGSISFIIMKKIK